MDFVIAILGWLIFNMWMFRNEKNKYDRNNQPFDYSSYLKKNWEDWVLSLLLTPVLALYLADLVGLLNYYTGWNVPCYEVYYAGCGVLLKAVDKIFSIVIKKLK